jgi:hypothetical protein
MKTILVIFIVIMALVPSCYVGGCSYRNVDDIKAHAAKVWDDAGFEIVGYEGYQIGNPEMPGGRVWYVVIRKGDASIRYEGCITKWFGEYHIYRLHAIDALKP